MTSDDTDDPQYALNYKYRCCGNCAHYDEDATMCYCTWAKVSRNDTPEDYNWCEWVAATKVEMDKRNKVWMEKYERFLKTVNAVQNNK